MMGTNGSSFPRSFPAMNRYTKPAEEVTEAVHLWAGGCGAEDGVGVLNECRVTCAACLKIIQEGLHD